MGELICPNCGSRVKLPEHSSLCVGMTFSKESNGTHYLNMEKENKTMTRAEQRIATLKENGIDTSNYFALGDVVVRMENGTPVVVPENDITEQIKVDGDVFNRVLDGRWIMAQMMHMLKDGYTESLHRKGYNYQWRFIDAELKRMLKREQNGERLEEKTRWFNVDLIELMLWDYERKLREYIDSLPTLMCKKTLPYKRLGAKYSWLTKTEHGDVFVCDLEKVVFSKIHTIQWNVRYSYDVRDLYLCVHGFIGRMIVLPDNTKMSPEFENAYKGNGAYYTANNMIRFHGKTLKGRTKEESLKALEEVACKYRNSGYKLLGWLKANFVEQE